MAELKDLVVSGDTRIHGDIRADHIFAKTISGAMQNEFLLANTDTTLSVGSPSRIIKTTSSTSSAIIYTLPITGISAGLHFEIHNASSSALDITAGSTTNKKIQGYNFQGTALTVTNAVRLNPGGVAFCTWTGSLWYIQAVGNLTKVGA